MLYVQSINDVNIPAIPSNKLRGDAIMLGSVYVCDDTHNEILDNIFQGKNYITMN